MTIPKSIIKSFLENNFGEIKQTSTGEYRINSIYEDDNKFHLYINTEKGVFNDFKSGESGTLLKLISEFIGIPKNKVFYHLIKEYSNKEDLKKFTIIEDKRKTLTLELPEGLTFFSENTTGIIRDQAWNYLESRGIPRKNIMDLGYIYCPVSEYDRTIFVPFYENGEIVYFITRDFTEKNLIRYRNPTGFNSKSFVYNIDKIEKEVFIFEGIFDALMLENQIGTAMLSADLGKEQVIKIWNKTPENIIFVPDNDFTGIRTLENNIKTILKYKPPSLVRSNILVYNIPNKYKDFGEAGRHNIDINECKEYNKFMEIVRKLFNGG
jgi:hypothetical protein